MSEGPFQLKLEAHDASRIEWSVYLMLPVGKAAAEVEVELSLQIPENAYTPHNGWDQLEVLARLSSPRDAVAEGRSVDEVRRDALAVARRMKSLRQELEKFAAAPRAEPGLARFLEPLVENGKLALAQARSRLGVPRLGDAPELLRERALADEFLGGQLLELLTVGETACGAALAVLPQPHEFERASLVRVRSTIASALADEFLHRDQRGQPMPMSGDAEALSEFLDRAALLKKHFQEVLFLERETTMVDQQWRNVVGIGGAAAAFLGYFALNTLQTGAAARAGLGVGTALTLGAAAYAIKDRVKELTRSWLAGKLSNLYAKRVLTLRAPARLCPARPVLLQARESLLMGRSSRPDPLNPALGAVAREIELRYKQRARLRRTGDAGLRGFERVKLVFRYDLSPLFTRLDDSVRRVPVAGPGRVTFADAPRLYRLPIEVVARCSGVETRIAGTVLLQRNGIERIAVAASSSQAPLLQPAAQAAARQVTSAATIVEPLSGGSHSGRPMHPNPLAFARKSDD